LNKLWTVGIISGELCIIDSENVLKESIFADLSWNRLFFVFKFDLIKTGGSINVG